MKRLFLIGLLAFTACAAQKSPEQIAEEQAALAAHKQVLSRIRITKEDPVGCDYISSAFNPSYIDLRRISYDDAVYDLREIAFEKKANTVVIDRIDLTPSKLQTTITGRLFSCP